MKKYFILISLFLVLIIPATVFAALTESVTDVTLPKSSSNWTRGVRVITWTFSTDAGSVARSATYAVRHVTGTLMGFHWIPDGSNPPGATANIQVFNALSTGVNLLSGICDGVGATETQPDLYVYPPRVLTDDTLYFYAVTLGAGTRAGVLKLFIYLP